MKSCKPSTIISLRKVIEVDQTVIHLQFDYREDWLATVKSLAESKYSWRLCGYYIPYTLDAFNAFVRLGLPYEYATTDPTPSTSGEPTADRAIASIEPSSTPVPPADNGSRQDTGISTSTNHNVEISWSANGFVIQIAYDPVEVAFLKALHKAYWSAQQRVWVAGSTLNNLEQLQQRYQSYTPERYEQLRGLIEQAHPPSTVTLYHSPEYPGRVMVKISGYRADVSIIKRASDRHYLPDRKVWHLPDQKGAIDVMVSEYARAGHKVEDRTTRSIPQGHDVRQRNRELDHFLARVDADQRAFAQEYVLLINQQRLSIRTAKTYLGHVLKLLKHYHVAQITDLDEERINQYIGKIASTDVSDSTINVLINAIKYWYRHHNTPDITLKNIRRPKKAQTLPRIISQADTQLLLDTASNLKHRCMLFTLYGGGIRAAELLAVKLTDVYWDRNQIMIRGAKGKKDRVAILSKHLKAVLQLYFDTYMPSTYLYEGNTLGKPYSYSSLQKMIKRTKKKAGISRHITAHTLRHSFATHLMDSGVPLPYIKDLLGHKDVKTTMIYTHISTHNRDNIESPLDSLRKKRDK